MSVLWRSARGSANRTFFFFFCLLLFSFSIIRITAREHQSICLITRVKTAGAAGVYSLQTRPFTLLNHPVIMLFTSARRASMATALCALQLDLLRLSASPRSGTLCYCMLPSTLQPDGNSLHTLPPPLIGSIRQQCPQRNPRRPAHTHT